MIAVDVKRSRGKESMRRTILCVVTLALAAASATTARAAGGEFVFKVARRNVAADPDGIWDARAFAAGRASLYEYELSAPGGDLVVSQIWNGDCATTTCPTRLVRIEPDGHHVLLIDDMMRQVIPPNAPRFNGFPINGPQAAFAQHPFRLSADGATLINGDFRFSIRGRTR